MARSDWYKDRADGLWTVECDPNSVLTLQVSWIGRYTGVVSVTPQVPFSEGGTVTATVPLFDDTGMVVQSSGAGGTITFRIAFGGGQIDDLTLRFRSVST